VFWGWRLRKEKKVINSFALPTIPPPIFSSRTAPGHKGWKCIFAFSCWKTDLVAIILHVYYEMQIMKLGQNAKTTGTNPIITGTFVSVVTPLNKICPVQVSGLLGLRIWLNIKKVLRGTFLLMLAEKMQSFGIRGAQPCPYKLCLWFSSMTYLPQIFYLCIYSFSCFYFVLLAV